MADAVDIAAADPALELTLGRHSLACRGVLNVLTRPFVLEAAEMLLARHPGFVTIDISELSVNDIDGANTFVHLQRMARDAGAELHWHGLQSDRLQGILPLAPFSARRAGRRAAHVRLSAVTRDTPCPAGSRGGAHNRSG